MDDWNILVNEMNTQPVWSLTSIELFYLGGLLQLSGFLGVEDPFSDCTEDDIRLYLQLARQSLLQRGYLTYAASSDRLDPALGNLLHTISAAAHIIIAMHNNSAVLVYLTPKHIVLQQPLPEYQVGFSPLKSLPAVRPYLQTLLAVPPLAPAPGAKISVAQPVLEHARTMLTTDPSADQIAACTAELSQTGLPPESAAAFALALAQPVSSGYITFVHRDAAVTQPQSGFAWLAGASGGWIAELPVADLPTAIAWQPASKQIVDLAADTLFAYLPGSPSTITQAVY